VPSGRAGRIWLIRRLAVAHGAADLLDQKVRVLRQQAERFALLAERSGADWVESCRAAEAWALRASLVGGQAALRSATGHDPAIVELAWATTMGVSHPSGARWTASVPDADAVTWGPATARAVAAHRVALDAAVQHAVALAALRAVETELSATRRRVRAVTDRWIPRLEAALSRVALSLEETERAEGVGLRWALRAQQPRDGGPRSRGCSSRSRTPRRGCKQQPQPSTWPLGWGPHCWQCTSWATATSRRPCGLVDQTGCT
jgi:V/A-type H+-transporting ATPase subunit D